MKSLSPRANRVYLEKKNNQLVKDNVHLNHTSYICVPASLRVMSHLQTKINCRRKFAFYYFIKERKIEFIHLTF